MSVASRFLARISPIDVGDTTLSKLVTSITLPGELYEGFVRGSTTHTAYGKVMDPDYAPAALLGWLAQFPGVRLQPGDTEAQERARIKGAAGLYRGTPRATIEEVQLYLTGAKTVMIGLRDDQWRYTVATKSAETASTSLVDKAIATQNPAGMLATRLLTTTWSWIALAPQLIATRTTVGGIDTYTITAGPYPTWQDVINHFFTWTDVINNTPH